MSIDRKISILIIEDNPGDQLLLHENLISTDLQISGIKIVDTLGEGIACLSKEDYSLIFLDLFLPDSSGLDSFSELIKINSRIPVIIYSGLADTKIALKAINSGAQDFLIKGDYTISLLEKAIMYSIERKRSSDALEASNERYNLVSKATHDMVWDWDLVTGDVYRNVEGWKKIFRTKGNKEVGVKEDWRSRVHPDDLQRVQSEIDQAVNSENLQVFESEFRVLRDDDTIGVLQDRGFIIRDGNNRAIRLIGASHDISKRKKAEQNLLLSEQRFKSLVLNGSDLLAILDIEGQYTYVSPASKKILGYDPEYFIGKSAFDYIHPDDLQKIHEKLSRLTTEKIIPVPLFRYKNSVGEWRWIESTITNLIDDPAVAGIVVNSRDVTDKKNADDEITKLSLVAKNTQSGVFILDKERRFQWVNEAFTKITGFTLEDAIGKMPSELLYGKDPDPELFTIVRTQMSKGLPFEGERLLYSKSGKPIWVWLQLQSLFDDRGEVRQYFAVQTDITGKKRSEDELKKLSLVAKETINGIIISDKDQNIVWVNAAFTKMFGYELEEVMGKNPGNFLPGPETDKEVIDYVQNKKKDSAEPFSFEMLSYGKSGNKILISVLVQPIFDEHGNVVQSFALQTDITEKRRLEEEVELEKLIKQKEITDAVFAAQESERSEIGREMHDNVNQLLGATRLYIDMARSNVEKRDSLLKSASTYTLSAIEEIRKLSKTLITPLLKEIGLVDSVKDIIEEIMHVHPVKIFLTADVFNESGITDKFKLNIFRIIQEQLNNIMKHAQAKEISINIQDNYGKLLVSIKDDGIGFDTTKRKAGVGLTNIKSRCELFNGIVLLLSQPGKGTTLSLTFNTKDLLDTNDH